MTTLLIDADIPIYEVASRNESSIPWPCDGYGSLMWTRVANFDMAKAALEDIFETYMERLAATDFIAAVTIGRLGNWRMDVYPDYKAHRSDGIKPLLVPVLRDWMHEDPRGRAVPQLEGDDVLGILATRPGREPGDCIVVSSDKDMRTIPGRHYNPQKDEEFEVTVGQANAFHLVQALAGDRTDGYPGCPGLGMTRAERMIPAEVADKDVKAVWNDIILPAYEKQGLDEEYALSQARVARILRATDYDPKKKKKVKLWKPK